MKLKHFIVENERGRKMKILMINKFLFPNGGSETYVFKLGDALKRYGHEVEYFGMYDERNIAGNSADAYTSNMDFHNGAFFKKIPYSVKTIYSCEARRKIRRVLDAFQPEICHLNNFNYQLTPSIILEIKRWRKKTNHPVRIVYTAHDYQLVCPNHMCRNPIKGENCEKCFSGNYFHCFKNKCIHASMLKSLIGMVEAFLWQFLKGYTAIDRIICCSDFMKSKLDSNPLFREKTITLRNFVDKLDIVNVKKKDYVMYVGRYHQEKGIATMVNACKELPHIPFVFAGSGPMESLLDGIGNIKNVGFIGEMELSRLIAEARFTVCPSEWYENCPFSVMESLSLGTPVLGSNIGGIPELIQHGENGELFRSGDSVDLACKIEYMWTADKYKHYLKMGLNEEIDSIGRYVEKLFANSIYM